MVRLKVCKILPSANALSKRIVLLDRNARKKIECADGDIVVVSANGKHIATMVLPIFKEFVGKGVFMSDFISKKLGVVEGNEVNVTFLSLAELIQGDTDDETKN